MCFRQHIYIVYTDKIERIIGVFGWVTNIAEKHRPGVGFSSDAALRFAGLSQDF